MSSYELAASWPQAAAMSRPRVRRTVAVRRCSARIARKASIRSGGELAGVLGAIVDSVEHHVLDEDLAAAASPVALAGGQHLRQRVAVVDRHQLRAQAVVGGVQGEGEADRHLALGEAIDA